jgi:hypothetical protein
MTPWCGGGVVVVFLTDNITTPTKVVLSCFGLLVGLWQLDVPLLIIKFWSHQIASKDCTE